MNPSVNCKLKVHKVNSQLTVRGHHSVVIHKPGVDPVIDIRSILTIASNDPSHGGVKNRVAEGVDISSIINTVLVWYELTVSID